MVWTSSSQYLFVRGVKIKHENDRIKNASFLQCALSHPRLDIKKLSTRNHSHIQFNDCNDCNCRDSFLHESNDEGVSFGSSSSA